MKLFYYQVLFEHKEKNGRYQLRKSLAEGKKTAVIKKHLARKRPLSVPSLGRQRPFTKSTRYTMLWSPYSLHEATWSMVMRKRKFGHRIATFTPKPSLYRGLVFFYAFREAFNSLHNCIWQCITFRATEKAEPSRCDCAGKRPYS